MSLQLWLPLLLFFFSSNCFFHLNSDSSSSVKLNSEFNSDNLIFGSDYPHMDHQPDVVNNVVELEEHLSQEIVKKIVWDNPRRFYDLSR